MRLLLWKINYFLFDNNQGILWNLFIKKRIKRNFLKFAENIEKYIENIIDDTNRTNVTTEEYLKIKELWKKYFYKIMYYKFGSSRFFAREFFDWGKYGYNWNVLHQNEMYKEDASTFQCLSDFYGELFYVSDRISYDRLFRVHWLWNRFEYSFLKEIHSNKIKEE